METFEQLTRTISSNLAASEPSAGGAEIAQVILATGLITGAFGALAILGLRHRSGKSDKLARASAACQRFTGLPQWGALPLVLATASLITALYGMYWDISLHIDNGRDAGPLANIAHYPILLGLMGVLAAGWLAIILPRDGERPGPKPIHLGGDWYAPVGGVLIFACGGFSLAGFPLDDVWHRLFGQDVTLWGPTHLMLLGGAAMTLVGQAVLMTEARWSQHNDPAVEKPDAAMETMLTIRRIALAGGLLIGVSIFHAEFDFGVPQFRMVFHPMLLALAAGFALTTARLWIGRGGALGAVLFFLVVRGLLSVFVGPLMGQTTPMLGLFVVEALAIEALAFAAGTDRPLRFGAIAGVLAGTVGFAAEWGWSQLVMPIPWTSDILPEGVLMATAAGVAGGLLAGLLVAGIRMELPRPAVARGIYAGCMAVLVALIANGLVMGAPKDSTATVSVEEASSGGGREGIVTARFSDDSLAEDASWVNVTSWQGGGLEINELERRGEGTWSTDEAVPLYGDWKSMLRVHNGRDLSAVPVFLPEDRAIPAEEVPAPIGAPVTRELVEDKLVLQREVKTDTPSWLTSAAVGFVGMLYLTFLTLVAWGVGRVGREGEAGTAPEKRREGRGVAPRAKPA
jgi:hypothetical protein